MLVLLWILLMRNLLSDFQTIMDGRQQMIAARWQMVVSRGWTVDVGWQTVVDRRYVADCRQQTMDGRQRLRSPVVDDGMWTVRGVHSQFPMILECLSAAVLGESSVSRYSSSTQWSLKSKALCSLRIHVYTSQVGLNVSNSLQKLQLLH